MEDFDENEQMAAMMGFSSFGGTKRKFDQTQAPAQDERSASGANSTELGVRSKAPDGQQTSSNAISSSAPNLKDTPVAGGLASFLARGQALPEERPAAAPIQQKEVDLLASESISYGGPTISRAELNALRFGIKNTAGDTAYFLPSFVEDPWEKLPSGRT